MTFDVPSGDLDDAKTKAGGNSTTFFFDSGLVEEIVSGGRVRIESTDPLALDAIHDFLRFQISEHHTGDTLTLDSDR